MLSADLSPGTFDDGWLHERHRYEVLSHVYRRVAGDCERALQCGALAEELGYGREEVYRILHELEYRGFLCYLGSGPRVRLTPRAVSFLLIDSGRRRSVRDADGQE